MSHTTVSVFYHEPPKRHDNYQVQRSPGLQPSASLIVFDAPGTSDSELDSSIVTKLVTNIWKPKPTQVKRGSTSAGSGAANYRSQARSRGLQLDLKTTKSRSGHSTRTSQSAPSTPSPISESFSPISYSYFHASRIPLMPSSRDRDLPPLPTEDEPLIATAGDSWSQSSPSSSETSEGSDSTGLTSPPESPTFSCHSRHMSFNDQRFFTRKTSTSSSEPCSPQLAQPRRPSDLEHCISARDYQLALLLDQEEERIHREDLLQKYDQQMW